MQANAQTMYRCGTTYSQTPCGVDQKEIELKVSDQCDSEENRMSSACIMRPSKPYKPYQPSAAEKKLRASEALAKQQSEDSDRAMVARQKREGVDKVALVKQQLQDTYKEMSEIRLQTQTANNEILRKMHLVTPNAALVRENKKVCQANISAILKDPESAKFGEVVRTGPGLDVQHELPKPGVIYKVTVNAKNSFGGYAGSKSHTCVFSIDEKLFISTFSP